MDLQMEYREKFCKPILQMFDRLDEFEHLNIASNDLINRARRHLQSLLKLRIVGWNSEHYDLMVLYPYLAAYFSGEEFTVVKRGNGKYFYPNMTIFNDIYKG